MLNETNACWLNGQIVPSERAVVSVFDHGLLYGDGVFEGIRFYNHKTFCLSEHLQRLRDSALVLRIMLSYTEEELTKAVNELITECGQKEGYIRLVITRGNGSLGIDPASCQQPTVFMIASPLSIVPENKRQQGLKLMISAVRRMPVDVLDPRVKSLNYLNNVMAKMQATIAGMDEAVMLNATGNIAEGSADNVFVVKEGRLFTPDVSSGALQGITRHIVIRLARDSGIDVVESRLSPYDLYTADECFLTGTGVELLPVAEVDGRKVKACPGTIYQLIEAAFYKTIMEQTR